MELAGMYLSPDGAWLYKAGIIGDVKDGDDGREGGDDSA
jgi:hypothetical protein